MDEKLLLHLLGISQLNSFIFLTSRGSKLSHRNFRLALVRDLMQRKGRRRRRQGVVTTQGLPLHGEDQPLTPVNRPDLTYDTGCIDPQKENEFCAAGIKEMWTQFRCSKYNEGLCDDPRFRVYHTKVHFRTDDTTLGKEESKTK
jgi:hypothetical protein